jgi:hypothetical protein
VNTTLAAAGLLVLGVAQMVGDLTGVVALRGIAAATAASPAPKVFSAVQGLETYSTRFLFEIDGRRVELTPELYSRLRGPYNRRNVYGAALAYAPVVPAEMREPVTRYALCGDAPLLRELGIDVPRNSSIVVVLEPLPGTSIGALQTRFPVSCGSPTAQP